MNQSYDAVVIGGGHNGLVAAAYLARAGCRVVLVERRPVLGGATLTEEAFPGFRFSVFSYLVSLLRPEVVHELDLVRHGLFLQPLASTLNPLPGGDEIFREADPVRTYENLARHSRRDAEAYFEYKLMMHHMARIARRVFDEPPPDLVDRELGAALGLGEESEAIAGLARFFGALPAKDLEMFLRMLTASAADFLGEWFEFDPLIAALSTSSIIGSFLSPRMPGSANVLLHHYLGEIDGVYRSWAYQKGGTGEVAEVIARSARAFGAEIRTDCDVAKIDVRSGVATGVILSNGEEISARYVLSSLAPQLSLDRLVERQWLPDETVDRARTWNSRGSSAKVNLALASAPRFACRPEPGAHLLGGMSIAPSLDYIENAYVEAKYGGFSSRPFLDIVVPSFLDRDTAPTGQHVMTCFVQFASRDLPGTSWSERREDLGDAVTTVLEEYLPGIRDQILHRQVMTPLDIENIVGIPGGNIFHGELKLSQLFWNRPGPWNGAFRTPIARYFLCGSGTHPGGGISGGPGRLAALEVIADRARHPVGTVP